METFIIFAILFFLSLVCFVFTKLRTRSVRKTCTIIGSATALAIGLATLYVKFGITRTKRKFDKTVAADNEELEHLRRKEQELRTSINDRWDCVNNLLGL